MSGERVFRLRLAVSYTRNSGSGEWKLYDDLDDLRRDLVEAYVDVLIQLEQGRNLRGTLAHLWRKRFRGDDKDYPRVSRILGVEQFVAGEWVELTPEFIDPDVILGGIQ